MIKHYYPGSSRGIVIQASPTPTGTLFQKQGAALFNEAVNRFEDESGRYRLKACRGNTLRFANARFYYNTANAIVDFRAHSSDRWPAAKVPDPANSAAAGAL